MITVNFINDREININETASFVRKFFSKKLDNYLMLSGVKRFDICSPKLDGLPSAKNNNARENFMMRIFEAQTIVKSVSDAINHLTNEDRKPYKKIIISKYVEGMQDQFIAQRVGYSDTRYKVLKRDALIEFAIKFMYYQLLNGIDTPVDLCKYKDISAVNRHLQVI